MAEWLNEMVSLTSPRGLHLPQGFHFHNTKDLHVKLILHSKDIQAYLSVEVKFPLGFVLVKLVWEMNVYR